VNRNLAAKAVKAKAARIEAGKLEGSKAAYTTKISDHQRLAGALASMPDVVMVAGVTVRRFKAGQNMRQHLRAMF
jgi:hypothetical protein